MSTVNSDILLLSHTDFAYYRFKILRLFFYLSHTQLHREYITSSEMYSLHLTHPKWTHTRSSGQPCYSARGAVGGSVPCSRTPQSWYWRRILPRPTIPAGPEIQTHNLPLTSPTRYPLGHDCPTRLVGKYEILDAATEFAIKLKQFIIDYLANF